MKFYLTIVLLPILALMHGQNVPSASNLSVDGIFLVDEKNQQVQLRGVSLGWHNWWHEYYNEAVVNWLVQDWNINVIRAAIGVDVDNNAFIKNPELAYKSVEKVIEAAIKNDIYVIVDWHSHNIHTKKAQKFFKKIAKKYGQNPNVIYEIFNEPDDESWPEIKKYSEKIIKTIRKIDPDNIILVGTPRWDQDVHIAAQNPILGQKNLMYTMHFYAGTHKKWLRDRTDLTRQQGLPIFVSEHGGMEATGDGPLDETEWLAFINWMEENNISWVGWSVSHKDESCSILKEKKIQGNWNDKDLKPWGILLKEKIKSLNK